MEARYHSGFLGSKSTMADSTQTHTKKLIVFDMDETLITSNTWLTFNTFLGVTEDEDYTLYKAFHDKEIDYLTWLEKLVALYKLHEKNISRTDIDTVLSTFALAKGAIETVEFCNTNNLLPIIITGSFTTTAKAVAEALGIQHVIANTDCVFGEDTRLIDIKSFGDEGESKVVHLTSFCEAHGIDVHTQCLAVGDSGNDIPLFKITDAGITFTWSKPEVQNAAKYEIASLEELPKLLTDILK